MPRGRKKSAEPKEEKTFAIVPEAEVIITKLCEKYPKLLWGVDPKKIGVYGCDNQDKPESNKTLAKIRKVSGVMQAVFDKHNISIQYIIELYWSDWNRFNAQQKSWVMLHEILHILDPDAKSLRKHNVEDFAVIVDKIGFDYEQPGLPDLLGDTPVTFNETLIAQMQKPDEEVLEENAPTPPEA